MPIRRILLAAATALALAAALGVALWPGHHPRSPAPALDERRAGVLTDGYRRDTVARIPDGVRYTAAERGYQPCPGSPDRYTLSSRYDLMPPAGSTVTFATLRGYWRQRGYRTINDTPGQNQQLLVQNPADGFRIGVSQRTARYIRLAIASPCLVPAVPPVAPVLPRDLAVARDAYVRYVAGQLGRLAGSIAALRTAVGRGDRSGARAAWLTAQLGWDRVGAAYGSFGDLADAIDGLPQGLPAGTADPAFTGLHRVEYGLWHGACTACLLGTVDRLATDVARLRGDIERVAPGPSDLALRAHEVLEDALRDHLTGLTDLGGHAGLAETWADVDATSALLDVLAPLIAARRAALLPASRAGLATLRQALLATRVGGVWPAPAAVNPAGRDRVDAALGAVLETLAAGPGLLEVSGS